MSQPPPATGKFGRVTDAVSDDRNWRDLIRNETVCADLWQKDWGFLAGDAELKKENATRLYTIDDKIRQVNEELEKLKDVKVWTTTTSGYGNRQKIEMFETKDNNINKNPELMPLSRKLPKGWKKKRFEAPDDPLDPLRNLFKKKK